MYGTRAFAEACNLRVVRGTLISSGSNTYHKVPGDAAELVFPLENVSCVRPDRLREKRWVFELPKSVLFASISKAHYERLGLIAFLKVHLEANHGELEASRRTEPGNNSRTLCDILLKCFLIQMTILLSALVYTFSAGNDKHFSLANSFETFNKLA